jgi:hypothetical protein
MAFPPNEPAPQREDWGHDLLLYGNEQILRGSDNGVLVAFAALAFQEIRGDKLPHSNVGLGFLLFSVLMCTLVHFAIGNAYVGRGRLLIRRQEETRRQALYRRANTTLAWVAGLIQLACILIGLTLIFVPEPPAFLREYLLRHFE